MKYFKDELIDNGDNLTYMIYTKQYVGYDVSIRVIGNLLVVESPDKEDTTHFHNEVNINNLRAEYNLDKAQAVVDIDFISVCIPKKTNNVNQVVEIEPTYFT